MTDELEAQTRKLLADQVADWRKEVERLQDMIAHATGSPAAPGTLSDGTGSVSQPTPTTAEKGAVDLSGLDRYISDGVQHKSGEYVLLHQVEALLAAQPVASPDLNNLICWVLDGNGELCQAVEKAACIKDPNNAFVRLSSLLAAPVASKEAVSDEPDLCRACLGFGESGGEACPCGNGLEPAAPTIAAEGVPSVDTPDFRRILGYMVSSADEEYGLYIDAFISRLNADKAAWGEKRAALAESAAAHEARNADEWRGRAEAAEARVRELEAAVAAKQAEIDRLMLEFCPNEMSEAQKATWGASQRAAQEAAKPSALEQFMAEAAKHPHLTAADLAAALKDRPEFADCVAKPSEGSGVAGDLERVARLLQSFADRLCNDTSLGEKYEGDESALREAIAHLRHQSKRAALAQPAEPVTAAARDVLAERARQISAEGWTPERDDGYVKGDLAKAAACYALHTEPVGNVGDYLRFWPWVSNWWKPADRRRNMVKAGALILAEIERIDRAERSAK